MNDKTRKERRDNTASSVINSVLGGATGTFAATTFNEMKANANKQDTPDIKPESTSEQKPEPVNKPKPQPTKKEETEPERRNEGKPEEKIQENPVENQEPDDSEVEVIAYERHTLNDGSQMDEAIVNVQGHIEVVIDEDLDGKADLIWKDLNDNRNIDDNEVVMVEGQGISMSPFQEAVGFNPILSQNDLPDYINNANTDSYMA